MRSISKPARHAMPQRRRSSVERELSATREITDLQLAPGADLDLARAARDLQWPGAVADDTAVDEDPVALRGPWERHERHVRLDVRLRERIDGNHRDGLRARRRVRRECPRRRRRLRSDRDRHGCGRLRRDRERMRRHWWLGRGRHWHHRRCRGGDVGIVGLDVTTQALVERSGTTSERVRPDRDAARSDACEERRNEAQPDGKRRRASLRAELHRRVGGVTGRACGRAEHRDRSEARRRLERGQRRARRRRRRASRGTVRRRCKRTMLCVLRRDHRLRDGQRRHHCKRLHVFGHRGHRERHWRWCAARRLGDVHRRGRAVPASSDRRDVEHIHLAPTRRRRPNRRNVERLHLALEAGQRRRGRRARARSGRTHRRDGRSRGARRRRRRSGDGRRTPHCVPRRRRARQPRSRRVRRRKRRPRPRPRPQCRVRRRGKRRSVSRGTCGARRFRIRLDQDVLSFDLRRDRQRRPVETRSARHSLRRRPTGTEADRRSLEGLGGIARIDDFARQSELRQGSGVRPLRALAARRPETAVVQCAPRTGRQFGPSTRIRKGSLRAAPPPEPHRRGFPPQPSAFERNVGEASSRNVGAGLRLQRRGLRPRRPTSEPLRALPPSRPIRVRPPGNVGTAFGARLRPRSTSEPFRPPLVPAASELDFDRDVAAFDHNAT